MELSLAPLLVVTGVVTTQANLLVQLGPSVVLIEVWPSELPGESVLRLHAE